MINEVNTVTGQIKNRRGQMFSYKFVADGTIISSRFRGLYWLM